MKWLLCFISLLDLPNTRALCSPGTSWSFLPSRWDGKRWVRVIADSAYLYLLNQSSGACSSLRWTGRLLFTSARNSLFCILWTFMPFRDHFAHLGCQKVLGYYWSGTEIAYQHLAYCNFECFAALNICFLGKNIFLKQSAYDLLSQDH